MGINHLGICRIPSKETARDCLLPQSLLSTRKKREGAGLRVWARAGSFQPVVRQHPAAHASPRPRPANAGKHVGPLLVSLKQLQGCGAVPSSFGLTCVCLPHSPPGSARLAQEPEAGPDEEEPVVRGLPAVQPGLHRQDARRERVSARACRAAGATWGNEGCGASLFPFFFFFFKYIFFGKELLFFFWGRGEVPLRTFGALVVSWPPSPPTTIRCASPKVSPTPQVQLVGVLGGFPSRPGRVGVGKGLNVKGKSAKKNRLSAFAPWTEQPGQMWVSRSAASESSYEAANILGVPGEKAGGF